MTVTAIIDEGTSCNPGEVSREPIDFDVPAGAVLGGGFVRAEKSFDPTNGSPCDRCEIAFLPNGITNTRQF